VLHWRLPPWVENNAVIPARAGITIKTGNEYGKMAPPCMDELIQKINISILILLSFLFIVDFFHKA
jgi:hypothetical protein